MILKFTKPYNFEGKEYTEIDLSGIDNLTTGDLIQLDKQFAQTGQMAMVNEVTTAYCSLVASRVTGHPIEFFDRLPAREGLKVRNEVANFLNS